MYIFLLNFSTILYNRYNAMPTEKESEFYFAQIPQLLSDLSEIGIPVHLTSQLIHSHLVLQSLQYGGC